MRKRWIGVICLAVLVSIGLVVSDGYKGWRQKRLEALAREFVENGDRSNADLCLRSILERSPDNLEACRMMAELEEITRSPQAVYWRTKLIELQPDLLSNRLDLAKTALRIGDNELAEKTLDSIPEIDKKNVLYHRVAGEVKQELKKYAEAEFHFTEVTRLEPNNPVSQLQLAALQLSQGDGKTLEAGRITLRQLSTNTAVRCEALRQLTMDAMRSTNLNIALDCTAQLLQEPHADFCDRMLRLNVLSVSTNEGMPAFLQTMQKESEKNPAKAFELCKWMLSNSAPQMALDWLQTLGPATRTNLPMPMIEADCYVALKNWNGLLTNSAGQSWGELDCIRLACRARAFKEKWDFSSSKKEWAAAIEAASNRRDLLARLLKFTKLWNWQLEPEKEELLWAIVNRYPDEKGACQELAELLYKTDKTKELLKLFSQIAKNDPKDMEAKNNIVTLSLLLNTMDLRPHELALELYEQQKDNPFFASTYAYSLYLQKKNDQALEVMSILKSDDLKNPAISGYYGVILTAVGKKTEAKPYFEIASKTKHLPEEAVLFNRVNTAN